MDMFLCILCELYSKIVVALDIVLILLSLREHQRMKILYLFNNKTHFIIILIISLYTLPMLVGVPVLLGQKCIFLELDLPPMVLFLEIIMEYPQR